MKMQMAPQFKNLVTFFPNKKEPTHNWYYYKEGFSFGLVQHFIEKFNIQKTQLVLDPFSGVGTTLLTCKQNSIPSIGIEASPLLVFASKVKTQNYDLGKLKHAVKTAKSWKFSKPEKIFDTPYIKRFLSKYALEDFVFYKNKISEIENQEIKNFLTLALMDSALKGSYLYKDGAVLKVKKGNKPPVGKLFKNKIRRMFKDLEKNPLPCTSTITKLGDSRNLDLDDNSIDFVITSPPYLNKEEYKDIYKFEYSLFPELKKTSPEFIRLGNEGEEYFIDMAIVIKELYRVCKQQAKLAIVIGGGCFPDKVIYPDDVLAELAEQVGFGVKQILIARESWCTRARTIKVGKMRESILMMEKY